MSARHHSLWFDKRLADAYDIVADVIADHATEYDTVPEVRALLVEIQKADDFIAGLVRDRTSA